MVAIGTDIYIFGGFYYLSGSLNDFYKIDTTPNIIYEEVSYHSNIFTEESPYYTEITIKASNLERESFEETLRFIKLGYDSLTVSNVDIPSYEINLTDKFLNYPINNLYNVLYSPLYQSDYMIIDSNLFFKNKYRNETFDIILTIDSVYQYIYRITESGNDNAILLSKPANYKYIIDESDSVDQKITFNNIFRNKFITDSSIITITNISISNVFDIESNSIFGYLPDHSSSYQLSNLFTDGSSTAALDITATNSLGDTITETLTFIKGFDGTAITLTEIIDTTEENILNIGIIELQIPPSSDGETVNIEVSYVNEYQAPTLDNVNILLDYVDSIVTASKIIELTATKEDGTVTTNVVGILEIDIDVIDSDNLYAIFTLDESIDPPNWVEVEGSTYNPETKTVQVSLEHFSKYAIFEIKQKEITFPILEWVDIGWQKPTLGKEITNLLLSEALKTHSIFTTEEYISFDLGYLKITDYIKSNNNYYKPKQNITRIIGDPPVLKESSLYYYLVDTTQEQVYSNIFTVTDITHDVNIKISYIDRTDVFTILDNSIHSYSITELFNVNEYFTEVNIKASNLDGEIQETLRFLKLDYNTLTVPNLADDKVSNIYMLDDEVSIELRSNFTIAYNPIESGCNLEISGSNLIVKDDYRGIYDTIINLGNYIVNIFRINERADNTTDNTYSL